VHKPRRIHAGQFRRRLAILKATLRDRAVPDDLVERFLVHQERFRAAVTVDGDCVD
jgi:hypothetical protein